MQSHYLPGNYVEINDFNTNNVNLPAHVKTNREEDLLAELKRRISNWDNVFSSINQRFMENSDLYRGTGIVKYLLNTKNKLFDPVLKESVNEVVSYLKTNPRSISIAMKNSKEIQDEINDIISKLMINNNIYNRTLVAFIDYLIYGISLIKIDSDKESVIQTINVNIKNCMWDLHCNYDDFKPSFFIHEYLADQFTTSNKYGYKVAEETKNKSFLRLNVNKNNLINSIRTVEKNGKEIAVFYGDDVFSKAKKVVSKSKVSDGVSQILEYYVLTNIKNDKEENSDIPSKCYTKYIYVNEILVSETIIAYEEFPYIAMSKVVHDADFVEDVFDSKIQEMKSEVIHINTAENSIIDSIAANPNGTTIIQKAGLLDKDTTAKGLKSNIIVADAASGVKLTDMIYTLPPTQPNPVMIDMVSKLRSKVRSKFGLINFDPSQTQAKSGYHESLRLDRESQSVSNMLSPIDNALKELGKIMFKFIHQYSKKSLDSLVKISDKPKITSEILKDLSNINEEISVEVSESRESPNNSMRKYNKMKALADLSGQELHAPLEVIAQAINADDETIKLLNMMNKQQQNPMEEASIREKNASADNKNADTVKKLAEAKEISTPE